MKERPILFQGDMVCALRAGKKTQTRRAVKWPVLSVSDGRKRRVFTSEGVPEMNALLLERQHTPLRSFSPYGQCGSSLWVRESVRGIEQAEGGRGVLYPSDGEFRSLARTGGTPEAWLDLHTYGQRTGLPMVYGKGVPSVHMPRWACRLVLKVKAVRLERLHDISRGDAMAEGCPFPNMAAGDDPRQWYADLWDQINGDGAWAENPWVWAVTFARTEEAKP